MFAALIESSKPIISEAILRPPRLIIPPVAPPFTLPQPSRHSWVSLGQYQLYREFHIQQLLQSETAARQEIVDWRHRYNPVAQSVRDVVETLTAVSRRTHITEDKQTPQEGECPGVPEVMSMAQQRYRS